MCFLVTRLVERKAVGLLEHILHLIAVSRAAYLCADLS